MFMQTLSNIDSVPEKDPEKAKDKIVTRKPYKICMHTNDSGYDDYRIMREATALVEAGFDVSIVDILDKRERPAEEEDVSGVHVLHMRMPEMFVPARFKPWFLVKSANMIVRGAVRLAR